MPFGNHWYDLIPILVLALLFFGAKRLPEMGSAVGKTIREFQRSMREVTEPHDTATTTSAAIAAPAPKAEPAQPLTQPPTQPTAETVASESVQQ